MLFNSIEFVLFFPLVTALYFLLPAKSRWVMLLLASCIFYMAWIPIYILILFLIISIDYFAALKIENAQGLARKGFLLLSIVANLGVLGIFKYYNFFAANISELSHFLGISYAAPVLNLILPIGLSFHTFQALSYTIEVYKGAQKAERHLGIYSLYVMFYPQLVAGPIERPQQLLHQLHEEHPFDFHKFTMGLQLMLWGFYKKVVIADRLAPLVNHVYDQAPHYSGFPLILATYCFALQIYCDFSGYSDIAIGAAQVMGINLMRNFDCPYAAKSIREFWQRWHISLSTWFRDYVYIPLGGSRAARFRVCLNLMIVFMASGLWHGANWTFVAWGFLHGLYLVLFLLYQHAGQGAKLPELKGFAGMTLRAACIFMTFQAVAFAWILFRANSLSDAYWIMSHLFPANNFDQILSLGLSGADLIVAALAVLIMEGLQFLQRKAPLRERIAALPISIRWPVYYTAIFCVLFLGKFSSERFIYFQF